MCQNRGKITSVARTCEIEPLLDSHPYDLSGGAAAGSSGQGLVDGTPSSPAGRAHKGYGQLL